MQVGRDYKLRVTDQQGQLFTRVLGGQEVPIDNRSVTYLGTERRLKKFVDLQTFETFNTIPQFFHEFVEGGDLPPYQAPPPPQMVMVPNDFPEWDARLVDRAMNGPRVMPADVQEGRWYTINRLVGQKTAFVKGHRNGDRVSLEVIEVGPVGSQRKRFVIDPMRDIDEIYVYPPVGAQEGGRKLRKRTRKALKRRKSKKASRKAK
jgi:hypothetical protein